MEYKYTINEISSNVNISKPSLYALIKKNQAFVSENSIRRQRKIYYNQAVMDFFVSYYHPDQLQEGEKTTSPVNTSEGGGNTENSFLEGSYKEEPHKREVDALKAEIDALKAEIDTLNNKLEQSETERKELIRQNGALILTLQQEKQEKMLLLPAPKKSFSDKVKSLFKGKS